MGCAGVVEQKIADWMARAARKRLAMMRRKKAVPTTKRVAEDCF
jgi:hypothetical protein